MVKEKTEVNEIIASYLAKPYSRILVPQEDGTYFAEIFELPGCIAVGDTRENALATLEEVAADWLRIALEDKQEIPDPFEASDYSGKFVLRISRSLHKKAAMLAQRDGVSLNQFIVSAVASSVGQANVLALVGSSPNAPLSFFQNNYFLSTGQIGTVYFGSAGSVSAGTRMMVPSYG